MKNLDWHLQELGDKYVAEAAAKKEDQARGEKKLEEDRFTRDMAQGGMEKNDKVGKRHEAAASNKLEEAENMKKELGDVRSKENSEKDTLNALKKSEKQDEIKVTRHGH